MSRFPDNARVCFVGDSITEQNLFVANLVTYYHKHFPDANVNFYNCGISGGTAACHLHCFDENVLSHRPTHIFLMLGVNDSRRGLLELPRGKERFEQLAEAYEAYRNNLAALCETIVRTGAEFVLCTPPPYAEYQPGKTTPLSGGFALMAEYAAAVRQLAREKGYALLDCHAYMNVLQQTETLYSNDRIHPNELGHYHLANCFLQYQGLAPDEYLPLHANLEKWRRAVAVVRNVYAIEHMVVNDWALTEHQKLEKVKSLLEEDQWEHWGPHATLIKTQCHDYLINRPRLTELSAEADRLMETDLKSLTW